MTLKEKFYISKQSTNRFRDEESNYCEVIADDFAIGFNDWVNVNAYKFPTKITTKELLEIYKKEKGL